jgi:hypothetical protein
MNERDPFAPEPTEPEPMSAAELQRLQQALLPLQWRERRFDPATLPVTVPAATRPRAWWSPARPWPWLLAAAVLLAVWLPWVLSRGAAMPLQPAAAPRQFVAGERPLSIPLGTLATITLRPGSELDFVHWRADQALFALRRGGLEAQVAPPPAVLPGFFQVDTPLGRVVDQGCRYTLDLDGAGGARVLVTEGAVTFARGERTVFVPVGAEVVVDDAGPSTPCFTDADPELRQRLRAFDRPSGKQVEGLLALGLKLVDAVQRPRDTLVLWHLLRDPDAELRAVAEQRLLELAGPPYASKQVTFDAEEWLPHLRLTQWQPPR